MSAVLTFGAVCVGKGMKEYVEESRLPLAQPFQEETTAMVIGDQVEEMLWDVLPSPAEKAATLLRVLCDVSIPLLLLRLQRQKSRTRTSSSRAMSMRRSIGSERRPDTGESSQ